MIEEKLLKREEKAVVALRSLYHKYGYLPYKMSKFEEYELYIRNKDFLVSDRIITFNDTNGKLLALKPDVTLSIIKSGEDLPGFKQKVYYNENVYRISGMTHRYKEIMQTGLECIGDIDLYDIYEVISLAAKSLAQISGEFVLEISHLGLLLQVLEAVCADGSFVREAFSCIGRKSVHALRELCERYQIGRSQTKKLAVFIEAYGERQKVIRQLSGVFGEEAVGELKDLSDLLDHSPYNDRIRFDFSVVNDRNYYSGFVFKGFLNGICEGVLAGGQYDNLMRRMERSSGAVGFALYLDLLEQLNRENEDFDVDVLLLYDEKTGDEEVAAAADRLTAEGKTVSAQKTAAGPLRYRELISLKKEETVC